MELLAAFAEHATASDCRVGAPAIRGRRFSDGAALGAGEHSSADQARPGRERRLAGAAPGHSAAAGTRPDVTTGRVASSAIGSADQYGDGWRARAASRADP